MGGASAGPLVSPQAAQRWLGAIDGPVAITGGTGFVGSHLVETLCQAGVRPRVLLRDPGASRWIGGLPVEPVAGSLDDVEALERLLGGARVVFHLAGVVRAGRAADFDRANRQGTVNLLRSMVRSAPDARLVHVSSQAALGPSADSGGLPPEAEPCPISAYGRSKLAAEVAVRDLPGSCWRVIVRPPAIYGPRDTDVLEIFRMAARGLVAVPSGERWVTVAFVADVVRSLLAAAARGRSGGIYHVGEPEPRPLRSMVLELAQAGGLAPRVVGVPGVVVEALGLVGSLVQVAGWSRMPLTRDKARELIARHWSLETRSSLEALELEHATALQEGAIETWKWYRTEGWLQ